MIRDFEVVNYNDGKSPCLDGCPFGEICSRCIDKYGNIINGGRYQGLEGILLKASKCKRNYPNSKIVLVEKEIPTRHVMVNKRGEEILSSNSFLGLMGQIILTTIGSMLFILLIGAVVCGIANIFS